MNIYRKISVAFQQQINSGDKIWHKKLIYK